MQGGRQGGFQSPSPTPPGTAGPPSEGAFQPGAPRLTWATAEIMSSPPAPPITSFDPWAALTKMEGTMDDGGRSPGTGGGTGVRAASLPSQPPRAARSVSVYQCTIHNPPTPDRPAFPHPGLVGPCAHRAGAWLWSLVSAASTGPEARC